MTGNTHNQGTMRHIPEDELHAYLDQALSRSQCVEIESHLAGCPSCQATRDGIAALRDRTTALLAGLAPPRSFPPEFDSLRDRAASQVSARRRKIQRAVWAASLIAAVGLGWTASTYLTRESPAPAAAQPAVVLPVVTPMPTLARAERPANTPQPERHRKPRPARSDSALVPPVVAPPSLQLSTVDIPRSGPELDGMWRTMSWAGAQAEAGDKLPHIDGLPVVQVQVQTSEQGKQPLMVVAQQLSSGEVIQTIEGPTSDVSHLLARRTMSDPMPGSAPAESAPKDSDHADRTMAMQRGDRMLVITGALPSDSLLAMIRRLNAEMRSK
jgi:putative zinc finger protein